MQMKRWVNKQMVYDERRALSELYDTGHGWLLRTADDIVFM